MRDCIIYLKVVLVNCRLSLWLVQFLNMLFVLYLRSHANEAKKENVATITVEGVKKQIAVRINYIRQPLQPRPEVPLPEPRDMVARWR